jgi:hypothetical protein
MYDEMEDYRRDAELDAMYKDYEVKVTVEFTYKTHARGLDEAEDEAYDSIKDALRGSHLDYDFGEFNTEEMD